MRLTEQVHERLKQHLSAGDLAIDATAGNGHDTLVLANCVGPNGHVYAIDLQETAIAKTEALLRSSDLAGHCTLLNENHNTALKALTETSFEKINAIVFNLGYLPGGDKLVRTNTVNTQQALESSASLLKQNGLLCVTAYRGHDGGQEEANAVEDYMLKLRELGWEITSHEPTQETIRIPPILWVARKTSSA